MGSPATPWLVAAVGNAVVGVAAIFVMREKRVTERSGTVRRALWDTTCQSVLYATRVGSVRTLLIVGGLVMFGTMTPNMQWAQLFGPSVGGMLGSGFLFTGMVLVVSLGSLLVPRFVRLMGGDKRRGLLWVTIAGGVALALTVTFGFPLSLAPFAVYELANGLLKPLRSASMNEAIVSRDRATVLSCETMVSQMGGALGLVATGACAEYLGYQSAWFLGAAAFLAAAVVLRSRKPVV